MIAHNDDILEQICETMYNINQDEAVRYWREAREDGLRIMRSIQNQHKAALAKRTLLLNRRIPHLLRRILLLSNSRLKS